MVKRARVHKFLPAETAGEEIKIRAVCMARVQLRRKQPWVQAIAMLRYPGTRDVISFTLVDGRIIGVTEVVNNYILSFCSGSFVVPPDDATEEDAQGPRE